LFILSFFKISELIHVEADNMLYGKFTSLLPVLRTGYQGLAATPLTANKSFITASVFWVANLRALLEFNDFLLELATNTNKRWRQYLDWLRPYGAWNLIAYFSANMQISTSSIFPYCFLLCLRCSKTKTFCLFSSTCYRTGCCRPGGVDPDKNGNGIKPYAINEMSMLAFYHHVRPTEFKLFPVVPTFEYVLNKYVMNMSLFGPGGSDVGPATGHGIWDPNSWGQLIGGTSTKKGRDKGFTDGTHIAGQAIRLNPCEFKMMCGNQTVAPYAEPPAGLRKYLSWDGTGRGRFNVNVSDAVMQKLSAKEKSDLRWWSDHQETQCYTAPFARFSASSPWTPLWNLHVHSKHTLDYVSAPCPCPA
jgi:hypothetical protein